MNVGDWLDHMDKNYHHRDGRFMGWVFCDLFDYYYGQAAWSSLKHRRKTSGILAAGFLAPALLLLKLSNQRMKWDLSKGVSRKTDEDATKEDFDHMWDKAEPVEITDWVDDDTMSAEETMRRFNALGPDETIGPP